MNSIIAGRLDAITSIAARHGVKRLFLFGSAVAENFDPERSDLDFLVEFVPKPPVEHADSYFGLLDELESLFGKPVDLIESEPIRNPYFRESVDRTKRILYEAA